MVRIAHHYFGVIYFDGLGFRRDLASKRARCAPWLLRFSLFEMQEFEPDGAGNAHQNISVIDKQAGQGAGIMFNGISQARGYGQGPGDAGNQVGQKPHSGRD